MRLIDADALREEHCNDCSVDIQESCKTDPVCASLMWVHDAPTIDAVPVGVLDQVRWERDVAIAQLNDYGVSFGEKADCVRVTRCKDCKHNNESRAIGESGMWCDYWGVDPDPDDFCRWGERRSDA